MRRLLYCLSLGSTLAFAQGSPERTNTFFQNGYDTPGYAQLTGHAALASAVEKLSLDMRAGWQFARWRQHAWTLGMGINGLGSPVYSYYGPVAEWVFAPRHVLSGSVSLLIGKGEMRKDAKDRRNNRDRLGILVNEWSFQSYYAFAAPMQLLMGLAYADLVSSEHGYWKGRREPFGWSFVFGLRASGF